MKLISTAVPLLGELNIVSVTVRLLLAMICGGAIGYFRDKLNKEAGFRTHILTCIGCVITHSLFYV